MSFLRNGAMPELGSGSMGGSVLMGRRIPSAFLDLSTGEIADSKALDLVSMR